MRRVQTEVSAAHLGTFLHCSAADMVEDYWFVVRHAVHNDSYAVPTLDCILLDYILYITNS